MTRAVLALRAPSANRVYTAAAGPLVLAEARWVLGAHLGPGVVVRERTVGGMHALEVRVRAEQTVDEDRLDTLLGLLSTTYGLFEIAGEGLLRPLEASSPLRHPEDLETILKYPGKTNEQFTALLVNLAASLSTRRSGLLDGTLSLLDPMCGRGTTLNRALRLGLSPIGADIDRKDVEAYRTFLTTWLRTHRYKHQISSTSLTVRGEQLGTRTLAELAPDKAAQRAGLAQQVTVLGCDTARLGEVLADRSVDAIVADLPYGVQHGAHGGGGVQRSPLEVLRRAAGTWRSLLRDGGGIALAVNRHTLDHDAAREALAAAGLTVLTRDGAFRHRVDQSIDRDVLLAVPSNHPRLEQLAALDALQEETPT